jgi:ubiquinone biosynthesis protein
MGPKNFFNQLKQNLPFFAEQLPHMPKLIFDVLTLKKEELLLNQKLSLPPIQKERRSVPLVISGMFLALLTIGAINYFQLIEYQQLTPITLIGAGITGLFLIINRTLRN